MDDIDTGSSRILDAGSESPFIGQASFEDYIKAFIQRYPRYSVKPIGWGSWTTKKKPLSDLPVKAHLAGRYYVASLGKWYPDHAVLDFDGRPLKEVEEIRAELGLDDNNSMLYDSESRDSYHLLLRPEYHGRPPTLNLLNDVFKHFCHTRRVEIFPQPHRAFRLPFSPHQETRDPLYAHLGSWREELYWFEKLEPFDLSSVKWHQMELNLEPVESIKGLPQIPSDTGEGLLKYGLVVPHTRNFSQYLILLFLFRQNVPPEEAMETVWNWIRKKHNGLSDDIVRHPGRVRAEIERQTRSIWGRSEYHRLYPDTTNNLHYGYITEPDLPEIIEAAGLSLPRQRFLFHLVKFSYPRRYRRFIRVHSDRLIEWASTETYLRYLHELMDRGIVKRGSSYAPDQFSKDLKLDWKFRSSSEAVLYDGRAIETFEETVRRLFKPDEFKQVLERNPGPRQTKRSILRKIWKEA